MPGLHLGRWKMPLTCSHLFFTRRTCRDPTVAAVVADSIHNGFMHHGCVVNIMNIHHVHVGDGAVIEEVSAVPSPAFEADAKVAESVGDPAVEPHVRTPVPFMENKRASAPTPIGWSPEESNFWS